MILIMFTNQKMSNESTHTIHKGWDTLPPLILPEKANAKPNITARQVKIDITNEKYKKAVELEEPKTFIIERITF
jgi:hypothetical protein